MLAVPTVSSPITGASALVSVGGTRIHVTELIAGQNRGRTEGMCQDPHMSECVHVVCRVNRQGSPITFGVMVGNEAVGGTTVAGRISV